MNYFKDIRLLLNLLTSDSDDSLPSFRAIQILPIESDVDEDHDKSDDSIAAFCYSPLSFGEETVTDDETEECIQQERKNIQIE